MTPQGSSPHYLFGGICQIADIPFTMSAASVGEGFVFIGKLLSDTSLQMENVITMLGDNFRITSIPEPVRSLQLTNLSFSYHTDDQTFQFVCIGGFTIEKVPIEMVVYITTGNTQTTFSGNLTINKYKFDVRFYTEDCSKSLFVATYHHDNTAYISLHDLVNSLSETAGQYIPASFVIDLKEVEFVFCKQKEQKQIFFGLQLSTGINLKEVPVIGDKLPDNVKLSLKNLQFLFASGTFTKEQIETASALLPAEMMPLPAGGLTRGMHISGELQVMEHIFPINTGNKENTNTLDNVVIKRYNEHFIGKSNTLDATAAPVTPDHITWFDVQKKLGPVSFQRIGVAFSNNILSFVLDASLAIGPAQLTMSGLTLRSSLSKFQPVFGLQGFFMSLKTSGFELGGGFLKSTTQGVDAYYGTVLAQAGSFSFKALGGHTPAHKDPQQPCRQIPASFFIYANIEIPIGGPPYFNLKGFVGGFGINNRLILPTLQELPDYVLLPGPQSKAPKQQSTPEATIESVLPQMQKYFIPDSGQYWMAAGISFSSFQMMEAFAVVTVSFGVEFQIALFGSCAMTLPKGTSKPIAYIEIAIMSSYTQSSGLLAVVGIISPASYLLGDFCRLTGGFAFYIWIDPPQVVGGPRAGDFLVSVGGYHPQFAVPAYYPLLPRVSITFHLSPLQVIGEAYFAMTPSMLMAGARLDAVWKLGIVKAWFKLGFDFIIAWAPFKYYAAGYINIGCSLNLGLFTLTVSIGASIDVWGPPFGGKAIVDLTIFSFIIYFGESRRTDPPLLTWTEFKSQFLPADTVPSNKDTGSIDKTNQILKATVLTGLNNSDVCGLDWTIDPGHFVIRISTFIPANELRIGLEKNEFKIISSDTSAYNQPSPPVKSEEMPYLVYPKSAPLYSDTNLWNPQVNIKPMGKNCLHSTLDFSLSAMNYAVASPHCAIELSVRPMVEDVVGALWDKYIGDTKVDAPTFLEAALIGFELSPLPRVPSIVNSVPINILLFKQGNCYRFGYQSPAVDDTYKVTHRMPDNKTLEITLEAKQKDPLTLVNKDYVLSAIKSVETNNRRNIVLQNLTETGFDVYQQTDIGYFGTYTALTDWPEILKLGDSIVE